MPFLSNIQWTSLAGTPGAMMWTNAVFWAIFGWLAMAQMIFILAIAALMIISRWRIFKKAGLPGRGIFVPVYNRVLMLKVGGLSGRWLLSLLVAIIFGTLSTSNPDQQVRGLLCILALLLRIVIMITNYFKIAKRFWKHWTYGLGLVFLKVIFIPILAFDNSKYLSKKNSVKVSSPTPKKPTKTPAKKTPTPKARAKKTPTKKPASPARKQAVKKVKTISLNNWQ